MQRDKFYHRERARCHDESQSLHHVSEKEEKAGMEDQFEMGNITLPLDVESDAVGVNKVSLSRAHDRDDATTAVTGATSDFAYSIHDSEDEETLASLRCARFGGPITAGAVGLLAFLSPVAMAVLPKIDAMAWQIKPCETECQTVFVSLVWRLLLLLIASCLLFLRSPRSTMPRIFVFRALIIFLIFILMFTYWLFYIVRVYSTFGLKQEITYEQVATFTVSFAEVLLFVHYLAVILIEVRQMDVLYVVKITRSPDGMARSYSVGRLSIQRLAIWCLEQYHKDFEKYNPYLDALPHRSLSQPVKFKVYDVDSPATENQGDGGKETVATADIHRYSVGHNDRFHQELEYERKVARRRARLQTAAEEAFSIVRPIRADEKATASQMSCDSVIQAVFQQLERPIDRYLRVTRQKLWYTKESILERIRECVAYDLSAKVFLEPYLKQASFFLSEADNVSPQTWTIVCDHIVSRSVEHNTSFQLCRGDIVLDVTVRQLPNLRFDLAPSRAGDAFVLRLDHEASV